MFRRRRDDPHDSAKPAFHPALAPRRGWASAARAGALCTVALLAAITLVWLDTTLQTAKTPPPPQQLPPSFLSRPEAIKAFNATHLFGYGVATNGTYGHDAYPGALAELEASLPSMLLASLRQAGFNGVRLAVDPAPLMAVDDAQRDRWIAQVVAATRHLVRNAFRVVVDIHPSRRSMMPGFADTDLIDGPSGPKFNRLVTLETRIAEALTQEFAPGDVAFELFNEPPDHAAFRKRTAWSGQLQALFQKIRKAAPGLTLIVSGADFGGVEGLTGLDPAAFDSDTMFSFHSYHPMMFTHQSVYAEYLSPFEAIHYMHRLPFPPRQDARDRAMRSTQAAIDAARDLSDAERTRIAASARKLLANYFDTPMDAAWIRKQVAQVATWSKRHGVAPRQVIWGEFGAWGDFGSLQGADLESRAQYLRAARQTAETFGFNWAVWELSNPHTAWGITNRFGRPAPELLSALFENYAQAAAR